MIVYKPELDSFRAYAALLVVFGHHVPWELVPLPQLTFGRMGVTAFFVLSGFLITSILLGYAEKVETGMTSYYIAWKTFFIRRALRIFPLYFAALFIFGFVFGHFRGPQDVWWHVTYTSNIGQGFFEKNYGGFNHFWSLCVEEQFYLLWPLLILSAGTGRSFKLVKLALVLSVLAIIVFTLLGLEGKAIAYSPIGVNSLALALGALLACLFRRDGQSVHISTFVTAPALIIFIAVYVVPENTWDGSVEMSLHDSSWAILCFYFLYLCASREIRLLRNKFTMWLGKISYGIYVYHMLISVFLWYFFRAVELNPIDHPFVDSAVRIGISIALAAISYYTFEVHFLRLKNKLAPD